MTNKEFLELYFPVLSINCDYIKIRSSGIAELLRGLPVPSAVINDASSCDEPYLFCMDIPGKGTCVVISDKAPTGWDLLTANSVAAENV